MATVKLTDKPVVQKLMDGDQVVLIQNGAVRLIGAEKVGAKEKLPKPDTAPDGAFLRLRDKKWVAESVPTAEGGSF